MKITPEKARAEYDRLNTLYYGGSLPDVEFETVGDLRANTGRRSRCWAATTKDADGFRLQFVDVMPVEMLTLKMAHEMSHIKVWPHSHRSKEWKAEIARLAKAGLLAEVF